MRILAIVAGVALVEGLFASLGLPAAVCPEFPVAVAIWAALRQRHGGDIALAVGAGLASGLFTVEAWTMPTLTALAAALVAAAVRPVINARSGQGLVVAAIFATGAALAFELTWRLLLTDLKLSFDLIGAFALRGGVTVLTIPVVARACDALRIGARL